MGAENGRLSDLSSASGTVATPCGAVLGYLNNRISRRFIQRKKERKTFNYGIMSSDI